MVDNMSKRGFDPLTYRFEDQIPHPGDVTEIANSVFWIRMPMRRDCGTVGRLSDHESSFARLGSIVSQLRRRVP